VDGRLNDPHLPPNMALQRTRRPRFRSLGSPLNARPLGRDAERALGL
jgi:hypothetical protein